MGCSKRPFKIEEREYAMMERENAKKERRRERKKELGGVQNGKKRQIMVSRKEHKRHPSIKKRETCLFLLVVLVKHGAHAVPAIQVGSAVHVVELVTKAAGLIHS